VTHVAIIGAGLAGLVLGRELARNADVILFEKARGVGGRMATRYAGDREFDHGAQFFTTRSAAFRDFVAELLDAGVVTRWDARFAELDRSQVRSTRDWLPDYPHYVGYPRMNSIGKHLAAGLDVRTETEIAALEADGARWRLVDGDGEPLGSFDWIVSTAPAAQTAALMPDAFGHRPRAASTEMQACFAMMVGLDDPLDLPWQAALVHNSDLSWVSVNSSKRGRPPGYALVTHARNSWADDNIDRSLVDIRAHMLAELAVVTGADLGDAVHVDVHRWRYANIGWQSGETFLLDAGNRLAACGDWCIRGRVEAAYRSAHDLATAMKPVL